MNMTHTLRATLSITTIIGLACVIGQAQPAASAGESDPGKPPAPAHTQPAKDASAKDSSNGKEAPNSATEPLKEPREPDEQSNKLNLLKLERDLLQSKADDLQRQLETIQQDLAGGKKTLADLTARVAGLEKEKGQIAAALTEARDQARDLATKLAAEQVKSATLREDKQRLMSGTTTAKEEIARLQKRSGELETEAARTEDLAKRLAERDQEIERLRKAAADRESLANKIGGLTEKLERSKQRVTALTEELAARSEEAARARQERDQLARDTRRQHDPNKEELPAVSLGAPARTEPSLSMDRDASSDKTTRERVKLETTLIPSEERRAVDEATKPSGNGADGRTAPKESSGSRLASAHSALVRSLEADIAKGELTVQNGRDRLVILLADRVLFDPGQGQMKPDGLKLLKKVSDLLKGLPEKHIRIETHPHEPPSTMQKDRGHGNWELSMARAGRIVQHFLDEGVVDTGNLAVGFSSDVQPAPGSEEDRAGARQTEIILSFKH
ncbi:MAG: OmpA family protein [Nitrospiraceae bacterium]